jgi:hypothetical protein
MRKIKRNKEKINNEKSVKTPEIEKIYVERTFLICFTKIQ